MMLESRGCYSAKPGHAPGWPPAVDVMVASPLDAPHSIVLVDEQVCLLTQEAESAKIVLDLFPLQSSPHPSGSWQWRAWATRLTGFNT